MVDKHATLEVNTARYYWARRPPRAPCLDKQAKKRALTILEPTRELSVASRRPFGASAGGIPDKTKQTHCVLGVVGKLCGAILGPSWGHLGAIVEPSSGHLDMELESRVYPEGRPIKAPGN